MMTMMTTTPTTMVDRMATGNFNKKFQPSRTPVDWLSRDEAVVDRYRSDRRTQFVFTLNAYYNMFYSLKYLTENKNLSKMPCDLPVFFIAGEDDPVGNFGLGVKKVVVSFRAGGMRRVDCKLYPHDRHEILNELDRADVCKDIWNWMKRTGAKL